MFYFSGMGPGSKGNLATVNIEAKNSDVKELLKMAYPGPNARWGPKEWAWIGLRKVGVNTSPIYRIVQVLEMQILCCCC